MQTDIGLGDKGKILAENAAGLFNLEVH